METYDGLAYCVQCKVSVDFTGYVKTSDSGRRMAQGYCSRCGTRVNRILGMVANESVPNHNPLDPSTQNKAVKIIAAQIGDPNDGKSMDMAKRVLTMLNEADPKIAKAINKWDDDREMRKQEHRWTKRILNGLINELSDYGLDTPLDFKEYKRNTIVEIIDKIRDKHASI